MEDGKLFDIDQKALYAAMSSLQKFRDQKATVPYMEHVFFESDGESLWYSMSDMENTAYMQFGGHVEIQKPFKICIDKSFILPLSPLECNISFGIVGDMCIMSSPDGKVTVPVLEAENFPRPMDNGDKLFNITEGQLLEALSILIPFTHPDTLSSNNSLHFRLNGGSLRIGAYDGTICAATDIRMETEKEHSFMLSRKSASMAMGILQPINTMCTVCLSRQDIVFRMAHGTLSCREMHFSGIASPNDYFRMSMPFVSGKADIMTIDSKQQLMAQIHKATVFNTRANQIVRLNLKRNLVTIEVDDTLMGRRSIQQYATEFKHEGKTETALLNCNSLMTLLRALPEESFELRVPLENGPGDNCIGIPLGVECRRYIFVIATLTT